MLLAVKGFVRVKHFRRVAPYDLEGFPSMFTSASKSKAADGCQLIPAVT